MKYHVNQVAFEGSDFLDFEEEIWTFDLNKIQTPHGTLQIQDVMFVEQGSLVGIQLKTNGKIHMDEFECSTGLEGCPSVKTLAVMRQPENVWLWVYAFDENDTPIANFGGYDNLDGLATYVDNLKESLFMFTENQHNSELPTEKELKRIINTITAIQKNILDSWEKSGHLNEAIEMNGLYEKFKMPLFFAWQEYKYGWHSDFWKEGDSMLDYTFFELQPKEIITEFVEILKNQSPFARFEELGVIKEITDPMIRIYEDIILKLTTGEIKL